MVVTGGRDVVLVVVVLAGGVGRGKVLVAVYASSCGPVRLSVVL